MGHDVRITDGKDDGFTIHRMTPAEHGLTAEGMEGLIESQFEMFVNEVETTSYSENLVRLGTIQVMVGRAQVHATLATAPDFYRAPTPEDHDDEPSAEELANADANERGEDTDRPGFFL